MSPSLVTDYKVDIASNKEIFFIFIIFTTILYFIYPAEIIKEQALKEKSNYALSALYLENMLQLDPSNQELIFATIKAGLESGKVDLAKKLIEVLKTSLPPQEQKKIHILQYKVYMIEEERILDKNKSKNLREKMRELLAIASQEEQFEEKYAFLWYRYALALSQKKEALSFIKPIYKRGDPYALEQCVYLATDLNKTKEKRYCTKKLVNLDGEHSIKWLQSAYIMYSQSGDITQAYQIIKKLAQKDSSYLDELARVEIMEKNYIASAKTFLSLYENSSNKERKEQYLINAIQALVDGDKKDKAVALINKYEDLYLNNNKMIQKFLRFYLAIGRLPEAQELSIKLMQDGSFE